MNEASEFGLDFVNTGIPKDKIDEIIQCVIKYVTSADTVETVEGHQFKVGTITIDTGFYHTATLPDTKTSDPDGVLKTNIGKFKTEIIRDLCTYMNKTPTVSDMTVSDMTVSDMSILAYSHGYVINHLLKETYRSEYPKIVHFAPNVSMFKEDYEENTMNVVVVDGKNAPRGGVFVRKNAKK